MLAGIAPACLRHLMCSSQKLDSTDAFLTILAANSLLSGSSSPPILVSPTVDFPSTVPAAIAISSVEVPAFLDKTPTTAATPPGNLIVINPGKAPSKDKSNGGRIDLLKGWKVHQVFTAELGDASTTALTPNTSSDAAMQQVCLRVVTNVNSAGVTADITNKVGDSDTSCADGIRSLRR